ncbi:MAG: glucose-6-phosphate dehydrogenase [Gammaproteobacteria bacterium]|nr:glucose-6-phosphate dehydrogenase [Gammaproteobacteria bacterium]
MSSPTQDILFDMVIFGGTGDLAMRKLLPALFLRHQAGALHPEGRIVATGRNGYEPGQFLAWVDSQVAGFIPAAHRDTPAWRSFLQRLHYVDLDVREPGAFGALKALLAGETARVRVFYLATAPDLFGDICENLDEAELITERARVVLEKPLGHDLASSRVINDRVARHFAESRIYRIDHYLGKETVQNLLVLRFGNALFESLWNEKHIDHIQITVAESIGVESRAGFYDQAGALRDMVQNHLLQLLCFVAMEPPASLDADAVRDEKLKVLRSLKPLSAADVAAQVVRGQYAAGAIAGAAVPAYRDEPGVAEGSATETFVALKAEIANWRWGKTPFYLRTGKRLARRSSEIVVQLKAVPHSLFGTELAPNRLVIHIQPEEDIRLQLCGKKPGSGVNVRDVELNLTACGAEPMPDAYERLLVDAIVGRSTLFMRRDELEAAWCWVEPILAAWQSGRPEPYLAGSWGPLAADLLLARDGRLWHGDAL